MLTVEKVMPVTAVARTDALACTVTSVLTCWLKPLIFNVEVEARLNCSDSTDAVEFTRFRPW